MRGERKQRNLIRATEQALLPNHAFLPDDTADRLALAEQLRAGLAALTEAQRACLILVRCECRSAREAAKLLHLTPTAVRMHIHRARAQLRRWLEIGR